MLAYYIYFVLKKYSLLIGLTTVLQVGTVNDHDEQLKNVIGRAQCYSHKNTVVTHRTVHNAISID